MNSDLISRQAAIDAVLSVIPYDDYWKEQIEKVVNKLPSAQTELSHTQKSCEYCHEDSDGYVKPIEKNNHAFVRFGMDGWELNMKANGWHGSAKIRYCPMCGRDLLLK